MIPCMYTRLLFFVGQIFAKIFFCYTSFPDKNLAVEIYPRGRHRDRFNTRMLSYLYNDSQCIDKTVSGRLIVILGRLIKNVSTCNRRNTYMLFKKFLSSDNPKKMLKFDLVMCNLCKRRSYTYFCELTIVNV